MIQERSPGTNLSSGACAGVLKHELGFPEAAVIRYSVSASVPVSLAHSPISLLLLVEPEDAARVQYHPAPPDSQGPVPEWREQYDRYPMGRLAQAIQRRALPLDRSFDEGKPEPDHVLSEGKAFLDARDTEEDRLRALDVIRTDRDWINRSIAAAILTNFPEVDSTWWALADVVRGVGPLDFGRTEGILALHALARSAARPVDWAPAAETLRAILEGTNLFAVDPLMLVLAQTEISPELAPAILGDGRFVLAYLDSPHPLMRSHALLFLRQVSGQDFGADIERWREWVASPS
jgi:hypothetical protein